MGFDRVFFKNISDLLQDYYKVYPGVAVTLTLRVADEEYDVVKILKCDDTLLTFTYYSAEKAHPLTPADREGSRETKAWPALTVPYNTILWVEFNPGRAASQKEIGFTAEPGL